MKTTNLYDSMKTLIIIFGTFFILASLTSCEKADDREFPSTYSYPTDVKTEALTIQKDQWYNVQNYKETCLDSKFYIKGENYEYIKVYIKIKKAGTQTEIWQELPFTDTYLKLENFKIYVQKHEELTQDKYQFLIELKLKS